MTRLLRESHGFNSLALYSKMTSTESSRAIRAISNRLALPWSQVARPNLKQRCRTVLAVGMLTALIACCGTPTTGAEKVTSKTSVPATETLPKLAPPARVVWSRCVADTALQCGAVVVPVDYSHPDAGSITIAVARAPALDSSASNGTLIFNPGGPGESANQILPIVLHMVPLSIRQHFNIVSFDPRGTGASDPLECGTSGSAVVSAAPVPVSPGEALPGAPVFSAMARECEARAAATLSFMNTFDTARDMDRIRQALGLSTISFYGLSYGTALGAVYADLFPDRVASMVLDGAVDVNATLAEQAEEEAPAAEQSLLHLFATCRSERSCPLGSDPEAFFVRLTNSLTSRPLPAPGGGDSNPVTVGDLDTATLFAITVPDFIPAFYAALESAQHGNGGPLRGLALTFVTDIDGAPLVDALWAITCNDAAIHPGPVEAGNLARALQARYPLIGAYSVTYTLGGCIAWPSARQPVTNLRPTGAPPIVVVGNTGDPNTPIKGAEQLAGIFPSASLVTWRGWGHTWLLSGPDDVCMQRLLTSYLLSHELPRSGTICN